MYKKVAFLNLLFIVPGKGTLTVSELINAHNSPSGIKQLDQYCVQLEEEYKKSGGKSFLVKRTKKDTEAKLRFDIAKDILETLYEEQLHKEDLAELRKEEQKLLGIMAKKQDEALEELSEKEIETRLKEIRKAKRA